MEALRELQAKIGGADFSVQDRTGQGRQAGRQQRGSAQVSDSVLDDFGSRKCEMEDDVM